MLIAVSKESFEPGRPILQTLRAARMTEEIHQNSLASVGPIAWLAAVCSPAKSDDYKPLNGFSLDAAASQFPCLRCFLRQAWLSHWFLTMKTPMEKIAQTYVSVSFVKAKRGSSNCTCTGCEGGTEESPYLDMLSLHPVVCDVLLPKISNKYTQAKGNEVPLNQASDDVILPKYKNCWSRPMS